MTYSRGGNFIAWKKDPITGLEIDVVPCMTPPTKPTTGVRSLARRAPGSPTIRSPRARNNTTIAVMRIANVF